MKIVSRIQNKTRQVLQNTRKNAFFTLGFHQTQLGFVPIGSTRRSAHGGCIRIVVAVALVRTSRDGKTSLHIRERFPGTRVRPVRDENACRLTQVFRHIGDPLQDTRGGGWLQDERARWWRRGDGFGGETATRWGWDHRFFLVQQEFAESDGH